MKLRFKDIKLEKEHILIIKALDILKSVENKNKKQ